MSTAKILPLFTYEAALNTFSRHFEGCDECSELKACPKGEQYAELAFRLLCPQPRRSKPDLKRVRRCS